jgi:hypothetical protein
VNNTTSITENHLRQVGEAAEHIGASAELWIAEKRVFVDAPVHHYWLTSGSHVLTEKLEDSKTLLGQMAQGFTSCDTDCTCCTSDQHWKPRKQPQVRHLTSERKFA